MCLWVEKAHIRELINTVEECIERIRSDVPKRSKDFLLELPQATAEAAIIFRDFPKRHGNIIQRAVGIALRSHLDGYSQVSSRFKFLSGLEVEVDNFFLSSTGQIYLFETKRDYSKVRENGVAARSLWNVKSHIENQVRSITGKSLRHKIVVAYFSYIDDAFGGGPRPLTVNIGTQSAPIIVGMPVYARDDMNSIIGPCFGMFLNEVDILIATKITELVPGLAIQAERLVSNKATRAPLDIAVDHHEDRILFGGEPAQDGIKVEDILE